MSNTNLSESIEPPESGVVAAFCGGDAKTRRIVFTVCGQNGLPALSSILPVLENMGVSVIRADSDSLDIDGRSESPGGSWTISLVLGDVPDALLDDTQVQQRFANLFVGVFTGRAENDSFNRLVVLPGIEIRHIELLRAFARYLAQVTLSYSLDYIQDCLSRNSALTVLLMNFFIARFQPEFLDRERRIEELQKVIRTELEAVTARDDDAILRNYFRLIKALLRTNFYQLLGEKGNRALSLKLDPAQIPGMPLPVPMFEIFVYSTRVEGVHLRGGKVARGGIRWSDRMEDYRTEVLGLIKTQMVKNAVIVPVGAKGGFICKALDAESPDRRKLIVEQCYAEYISALLDVTDNYIQDRVVAPKDCVCHDDEDPYLVVAADKGTATFSDLANAISLEYDFWLGDAFASGGKYGYDHKKMGITARGAWESARRLFFERGIDIQAEDFTVVGIGDMSGDVFGNGMLLSEHIRLLAAFDHRHIFLDPDPDAATSYRERQRLFDAPGSCWEDYDPAVLSEGAQIISRTEKEVLLTPQSAAMLGVEDAGVRVSTEELIQLVLQVGADMLWNGGVGTYIKSSQESHLVVGDKHNDGVRINANELNVAAVVEGGNLGLTQLARIEYAAAGGLICTDAVDNAAGVDCSDHEVNIKVLLNQIQASGQLDEQQRNQLLADMTEDVAELVLKNNRQQCRILSQSNYTAPQFLDKHAQLIELLEQEKRLDRQLEYLPTVEQIEDRTQSGKGLLRPEIAVLLGYSKTRLFRKLTEPDSSILDDPFVAGELHRYFPEVLRERYAEWIDKHPLRKEILACQLTNKVANRMGATFCNYVLEEQKLDASQLVKAYTVAYEVFNIRQIEQQIERHAANRVPSQVLLDLQLAIHHPLDQATRWLLDNDALEDVGDTVEQYSKTVADIRHQLLQLLPESESERLVKQVQEYQARGIEQDLARQVAELDYIAYAFEIAAIAKRTSCDSADVLKCYFSANQELQLFWLRSAINALPMYDEWQRKNKDLLLVTVSRCLATYVSLYLLSQGEIRSSDLAVYQKMIRNARSKMSQHLAMVSVLVHRLSALVA